MAAVRPFSEHLLMAFDALEQRFEDWQTGHRSVIRWTPGWMGQALDPWEWTWEAPRGRPTALAGPVGLQLGWATSYVDAVVGGGSRW